MPGDHAEKSNRTLALLAALLAVVMFVFPLAVSFPLLDPDEGLHAAIAQGMVERGDWITPEFLGRPFLDKPIFYFWMQAASIWLLGSRETAVRLPGLMFGLLGAVTTGLLGWRLFIDRQQARVIPMPRDCGREGESKDCCPPRPQSRGVCQCDTDSSSVNDCTMGFVAGILYATTILPTALAQAASHDVALIPWINLTLLFFWESERAVTQRKLNFCLIGAGVFLGLAILTKGLFGAAVVGLAYGGYLLITRRIGLGNLLNGAIVLAIGIFVASPWYVLVEIRHPGYLQYFFLDRHLLGLLTESQPHGDGPWWYYLPVLLGGGLPWIGYLPIVVQDAWAGTVPIFADTRAQQGSVKMGLSPLVRKTDATALLWCWLIGWTLLMQLAGSKLATYLWPVFPPIAILAATAWAGLIDATLGAGARRSFARTFVSSSLTGPIVLPSVVLVLQAMFGVWFSWPVWTAVGVVAILTPMPLVPWFAGRRDCPNFRLGENGTVPFNAPQASLAAAALSLALQFTVAMALVFPPLAETCSARELAEYFNRFGQMPPRLLVVEGRIGSLVFYLDPPLRDGLTVDQLQQWSADDLPQLHPGDMIAVPERKVRRLRGHFDVDHNRYETVGPYRLYTIIKPRPVVAPGSDI